MKITTDGTRDYLTRPRVSLLICVVRLKNNCVLLFSTTATDKDDKHWISTEIQGWALVIRDTQTDVAFQTKDNNRLDRYILRKEVSLFCFFVFFLLWISEA